MTTIGTPFTATATKVLMLGSGELGKELAIELQRLGVEVIACDRYANAPGMQVADRSYTFSMLDEVELRRVIELERPNYILPEIEAIATQTLVELETEGFHVVPSARAAQLTMNREGIRRLVAEELAIPASAYRFAATYEEYQAAIAAVGIPCVIKPIMSSSGKGQSMIKNDADIESAWYYAQEGGRGGAGIVIVEGFVDFDYEITLLTIQHVDGVSFCEPIGHRQEEGDYRESWQPQNMSATALAKAKEIATKVTGALGGHGVFGVEFFIKGDDVLFSEVSPRPHDTGMVTLISQDLSEFALHARAILGLSIPTIRFYGASASAVLLVEGKSTQASFGNLRAATALEDASIRLFGKPEVTGKRRMGVALARGATTDEAVNKALAVVAAIDVTL